MNIIPWHRRAAPLENLGVEDLFARFFGNGEGSLTSHLPKVFGERLTPAVNIAETEDSFCITMDCPGLSEEDFKIEMMGTYLVISGERKWEEEKKGKDFRRVESQYGSFQRSVELPGNVKAAADEIQASYKKGVLEITVPKHERTPAATIPVTSAD